MSLLDDAKQIKPKKIKERSDEEIELASAWVKDEVNLNQVSKVMKNTSGGNALYAIASCLKVAYQQGKISIN